MILVQKLFFRELLRAILAVLIGFLMLFMVIDTLTELAKVGQGDYKYSTLIQIVVLKTPEYVYQLLPICALIGSVLAISNMSAHSELVVWRVSGLSSLHLTRIILTVGIGLVAAVWLIGNGGISNADRMSQEISKKALHRNNFFSDSGGYWSKQVLPEKGFRMINAGDLIDSRTLINLNFYELTPEFTLIRLIQAKSATPQTQTGVWQLRDVRVLDLENDAQGMVVHKKETTLNSMNIDLAENTLEVFRNYGENSRNMTVSQLNERIASLSSTGQNPREFISAYWHKIFYPFSVFVMMLLAVPFAFMQTRKGGVGLRVFIGFMFGLLFFVLSALTQALSSLIMISPILIELAPLLVFLLIALIWIRQLLRAN